MAIVVVTMIAIVLTAVAVLGAAYATHLIARSPRFRARIRRWGFALAASLYSARRELGCRLRRMAGATARRVGPIVNRGRSADVGVGTDRAAHVPVESAGR